MFSTPINLDVGYENISFIIAMIISIVLYLIILLSFVQERISSVNIYWQRLKTKFETNRDF